MKKQYVKILKSGEYCGFSYKKDEVYLVLGAPFKDVARISNDGWVTITDHYRYGKEAEIINNNSYELWEK